MSIRAFWVCLVAVPLTAGCTGCQGDGGNVPSAASSLDGSMPDAVSPAASSPEAAPESAVDVRDGADEPVDPPHGIPQWEALADPVVGCNVDRLTNASELKLFDWQACVGIDACEEAVLNPDMIETTAQMLYDTPVTDGDAGVIAAIGFESPDGPASGVYFARQDGQVLSGFRTLYSQDEDCNILGAALWKDRFGVVLAHSPVNQSHRIGGLVGRLAPVFSASSFEISPLPSNLGATDTPMGEARWLWRWYPDQLSSYSNVDGSGGVVFAHIDSSILMLGGPTAVGPAFLSSVVAVGDGGQPVGYVGVSDGVAPLTPYIEGTPDVWTGAPAFANSHVAWMRGIHPHGDYSTFDSVELWASEFHSAADPLQPYKVGDSPSNGMAVELAAGWGYFATRGLGDGGPRPRETLLWNLATKVERSITLPVDRQIFSYPGITHTDLWILAQQSSTMKARYLMRIALQ